MFQGETSKWVGLIELSDLEAWKEPTLSTDTAFDGSVVFGSDEIVVIFTVGLMTKAIIATGQLQRFQVIVHCYTRKHFKILKTSNCDLKRFGVSKQRYDLEETY